MLKYCKIQTVVVGDIKKPWDAFGWLIIHETKGPKRCRQEKQFEMTKVKKNAAYHCDGFFFFSTFYVICMV